MNCSKQKRGDTKRVEIGGWFKTDGVGGAAAACDEQIIEFNCKTVGMI